MVIDNPVVTPYTNNSTYTKTNKPNMTEDIYTCDLCGTTIGTNIIPELTYTPDDNSSPSTFCSPECYSQWAQMDDYLDDYEEYGDDEYRYL